MTNKKGDKKGEKRKQKGDKADTVTNKKDWRQRERAGKQGGRNDPGRQSR